VAPLVDALEDHLRRQAERSRDFFWNRVRWELIESQLPSTPFALVDVGAGPGFLGDFLAANRPDVTYRYAEPLRSLEESLESRFGAENNVMEADYAGASVITMLDVLEHIGDDRAFLTGLAEKMDSGATLLLTVPALPSLWSNWDLSLGHYRRYTKSALSAAVGSLPFEIVEESYLFPELIPLAWWRRRKDRRRGTVSGDAGEAEFPDLSRPVNESLYRLSSASKAARRLAPAGTSLFARLQRH
jgi:hypothetical protein